MFQNPILKLYSVLGDTFYSDKKYTLGRILTIIDASIPDPEQRKGIKDLIQGAYWANATNDELKEVLRQFFVKYVPKMFPGNKEESHFLKDQGRGVREYINFFKED